MAAPPQIDIVAPKRVPFDDTIARMWEDYSGATPLMEIRSEPGVSGDPVVSLGLSSAGSQGLIVTYDADFPDPDDPESGTAGASLVRIIINETTLEGLEYGADREDRVVLYYDIHLTPTSGKKFVFCAGRFIVDPGVTV